MEDPMNAQDVTGPDSHSDGQHLESGKLVDAAEMLQAAETDACVLFTGFKDARTLGLRIHRLSRLRWTPFVAVDCGWPEALLNELLFGVRRSDSDPSDAPGPKSGLLGAGTIFLTEVGKLSPDLQVHLLGALGHASTMGGPRGPRKRVMACTSESLLQRVLERTFDDRLFYRLNVIHLVAPAGRDA
jgi:DNA-binding NtrC family response regulator